MLYSLDNLETLVFTFLITVEREFELNDNL